MSTILIIDDNDDYRMNLMELLTLEDYIVLGAENGLVGLQMIRQHLPDLVLCDVNMPVMDGIEALRTIKTEPQFDTIPFAILSANGDQEVEDVAHELGAAAYLTKSSTITVLLSAIVRLLGAKVPHKTIPEK